MPQPSAPVSTSDPLSRRGDLPNYLTVYALCLILGMILGAASLIVASPWLPFVLR
jgi:hypothetical protein